MDKPVKIVHLSTQTHPHTPVGAMVHALAMHARNAGAEVTIAAGYGDRQHADLIMQPRWKYRLNTLMARMADCDGFLHSSSMKSLFRTLDNEQPQILHIHNMHGYYLDLVRLSSWLYSHNIHVVLTLHDLWMVTGRCAFPPRNRCDAWVNGCHRCPARSRYPAAWNDLGLTRHQALKTNFIEKYVNTLVTHSSQIAADTLRHLPDAAIHVLSPAGTGDTDNHELMALAASRDPVIAQKYMQIYQDILCR